MSQTPRTDFEETFSKELGCMVVHSTLARELEVENERLHSENIRLGKALAELVGSGVE